MSQEHENNNRLFNNRFLIKKRISQGSFGVVFLCQDLQTKDYVAMKVEKESLSAMSLDREIKMLENLQGIQGIPKLFWAGNQHNHNCLVLQLLGKDLSYHVKALKKFSLKCIVNIAIQTLQIIEKVHKKGIIHRDIKPENIMTGREQEQNSVFLADFGISKFYKENDGTHVPFKDNKFFVGTTRYASIGAHLGYEQSRRDDLESIGYMIIYLFKGSLPWQTVHNMPDKEKTKQVGLIKQQTELVDLCSDCPKEFLKYFQYVKSLQYKSSPDYKYLTSLFEYVAKVNGFSKDQRFDWNDVSQGTTRVSLEQTQGDSKSKLKQSKEEAFKTVKNIEPQSTLKSENQLNVKKNSTQIINKKRQRQRSKFEQQLNYSKNSDSSSFQVSPQQSSVALNYQNSQFSNNNLIVGSAKRLGKLSERQFYHKDNSRNSLLVSQQSVKTSNIPSLLNQQLSQQGTIQLQNSQFMQYAQEDFQDLEELEEKLKKDKKNSQREKPKIPLTVKQHHDQQEQTDLNGMTQFDEDNLECKIQMHQLKTKMKQHLPKY